MNYHNITNIDMVNGEGLRVVLWLSGCAHHCEACHNPETWDDKSGILFDEEAKKELFMYLQEEFITGLTLSGGDPLYLNHREEVESLLKQVKEKLPNKTVWVYTGYLWEEIKEEKMMDYIDVLIDGKFQIEKVSSKYPWAGSTNQRIIDVKESLKKGEVTRYADC